MTCPVMLIYFLYRGQQESASVTTLPEYDPKVSVESSCGFKTLQPSHVYMNPSNNSHSAISVLAILALLETRTLAMTRHLLL